LSSNNDDLTNSTFRPVSNYDMQPATRSFRSTLSKDAVH
jgi:hypothetical protein